MAKCPHCNSCYRVVWLDYKAYRVCTLCRKVFQTSPGGNLTPVMEPEIIRNVLNMIGPAV